MCIWDDLVDIPVVVPMRVPSAEIRRRKQAAVNLVEEEEEMDISAARGTPPYPPNSPSGISAPADLPTSSRFQLAPQITGDEFPLLDSGSTPASTLPAIGETSPFLGPESGESSDRMKLLARPRPPRNRTRLSYEEPRRVDTSADRRKRNFSFTVRRTDHLAEEEADLGYGGAPEMESTMKKVIVERIELVKSRNPVFTWC